MSFSLSGFLMSVATESRIKFGIGQVISIKKSQDTRIFGFHLRMTIYTAQGKGEEYGDPA